MPAKAEQNDRVALGPVTDAKLKERSRFKPEATDYFEQNAILVVLREIAGAFRVEWIARRLRVQIDAAQLFDNGRDQRLDDATRRVLRLSC